MDENTISVGEIIIELVGKIVLMVFAFAIGFGLWRLCEIQLRKWRESAFDYVYESMIMGTHAS